MAQPAHAVAAVPEGLGNKPAVSRGFYNFKRADHGFTVVCSFKEVTVGFVGPMPSKLPPVKDHKKLSQ